MKNWSIPTTPSSVGLPLVGHRPDCPDRGGWRCVLGIASASCAAPTRVTRLTAPKPLQSLRRRSPMPLYRHHRIRESASVTITEPTARTPSETMGEWAAFLDMDGDGDSTFRKLTTWLGHEAAGGKPSTAALHQNDGAGNSPT